MNPSPNLPQFASKRHSTPNFNPPYVYAHLLMLHPHHPPLDLYTVHRDVVAARRRRGWVVVGSGAR